jgi:hypothetical protein
MWRSQRRLEFDVLVNRMPNRERLLAPVEHPLNIVSGKVSHLRASKTMKLLGEMKQDLNPITLAPLRGPLGKALAELPRKFSQAIVPGFDMTEADTDA